MCVLLSIFQNNLFGSDFFRAVVLLGQRPDGNNTSFFHIHFYGSDFFRPKINANDVKTTFFILPLKSVCVLCICVCTVYLCVCIIVHLYTICEILFFFLLEFVEPLTQNPLPIKGNFVLKD